MVSIPKPWQKERLAAEDTNGGPVPPEVCEQVCPDGEPAPSVVRGQVSVGGSHCGGSWRSQRLGNIRGRLRQRMASLEIHEITIETGI
jgi:hypothetical protein